MADNRKKYGIPEATMQINMPINMPIANLPLFTINGDEYKKFVIKRISQGMLNFGLHNSYGGNIIE